MATIPDTPQIADALATLTAAGDAAQILGAAVDRLRVLHQLGATEERTATVLRADRDAKAVEVAAITAERDTLATERDTLTARVAALESQVAALTPSTDGGVPVRDFKRRLAPLYFTLGAQPEGVQRQWDRVLGLIDSFTTIYPTQQPVAFLIAQALAAELLTEEQAAALSAPIEG